ncbi:hypothetical protein ACH5RR_003044 [Cinchona calisaya]|uniref:Uncharacterized protein n=1 Tax=Cinchona calisaya TaxID=153742 RepID=A0ABD3ATU1_9GENT
MSSLSKKQVFCCNCSTTVGNYSQPSSTKFYRIVTLTIPERDLSSTSLCKMSSTESGPAAKRFHVVRVRERKGKSSNLLGIMKDRGYIDSWWIFVSHGKMLLIGMLSWTTCG